MPKRPSTSNPNELATGFVAQTTDSSPPRKPHPPKKNPAAVALGRLGGKKGGKARAAKLTAEERSEIARKAASIRWGKKDA